MIDTLRLILFTDCQMDCSYCCNKQEQFSSQFIEKSLDEINFLDYKNVCLTGGEPFLKKHILYKVLKTIPRGINIYIYTNGILITEDDIDKIEKYKVDGINIGLHHYNQPKAILNNVLCTYFPIRYMTEDLKRHKFSMILADLINKHLKYEIKTWHRDDCNMPNEDWILLKEEKMYFQE